MARPPSKEGDIKVRPKPHEKAVFIEAAEKARQTLGAWMMQAALERAERQGLVPVDPMAKKKDRR